MSATCALRATDPVAPADLELPAASAFDIHRAWGEDEDCRVAPAQDWVIEEVPVALVYNGLSHAVMLASPTDLADFALGFSLSEGILAHAGELYDCEAVSNAQGVELRLEVASRAFADLKARRRALAGRTGCGLCGVDSLAAVSRPLAPVSPAPLSRAAVARALAAFPEHQPLRQQTGAAHAAAWVAADGRILALREDVGRHNALDKLIGWRAGEMRRHAGFDAGGGFALVSSRASFEMVQKSAQAGIGALVAVSAPTGMAVRLARDCGLLLAGYARGERFAVYAGESRIRP